jgi:NitT/TauT family transport system substrate-binding protein
MLNTQSSGEAEQQVVSGSADVGLGVGAMEVLRAYSRGAPVRIIGANTNGAAYYWYVPANSPIQGVKDLAGKGIAYSTHGSAIHYAALDLLKQFRLKARLILTGERTETLNAVMQGHVDVGWAAPPFGVDEVDQGKIRVVARANDIVTVRDKTSSVLIANAAALDKRKDVLARFMQAYRETVAWMYSDPDALKRYAELAGASEGSARRLRDEFFTKDMLLPDKLANFSAVMKDAVTLRYLQARLSRGQAAELVQIPSPIGGGVAGCQGSRWACLIAQ